MGYDNFLVFARDLIKKLPYETKHEIDAYFGAWLMNPTAYKPCSGGQKKCHKVIDKLWQQFERSKQ